MDTLGMTNEEIRRKCEELADLVKKSIWFIEVLLEEVHDDERDALDEQNLLDELAFVKELKEAIK